jgi:hypothetical protein
MSNDLTALVKELQQVQRATQVLRSLRTGELPLPLFHVMPQTPFPENLDGLEEAVEAAMPVEFDLEAATSLWTPEAKQRYREILLSPLVKSVAARQRTAAQAAYTLSAQILQNLVVEQQPQAGGDCDKR